MSSYPKFSKIPRLYSESFQITEKIDGTNGLIYIEDSTALEWRYDADALIIAGGGRVFAGSRTRWIYPDQDNHGFAAWVYDNAEELATVLGPGHHYGEWAGPGINKNRHGLEEKTFFLFNVKRWAGVELPANVRTVPILAEGVEPAFLAGVVQAEVASLDRRAEGVVVRSDLTGTQWKYFVGGVAANATTKGQAKAA